MRVGTIGFRAWPERRPSPNGSWRTAASLPTHRPPVEDFSWWSGIPLRQAREFAEGLLQLDAPPLAVSGVRLLPVWDNLLMGHRDRSRVLAPEHDEYVFDKDGNATSTFFSMAGWQGCGTSKTRPRRWS